MLTTYVEEEKEIKENNRKKETKSIKFQCHMSNVICQERDKNKERRERKKKKNVETKMKMTKL